MALRFLRTFLSELQSLKVQRKKNKVMIFNLIYLAKAKFTMEDRKDIAIKYIQEKVGEKKVLVLVSGGVDSSVCAALLYKALGKERVFALHVNNGFMRKEVRKMYSTFFLILWIFRRVKK